MGFMLAARERPADTFQTLSARKSAIEAEIEAQHDILKANNADFNTPLVDSEGFPRADLDVWAVRTARVRIIELRNDYKAVLDDLSKTLQTIYAKPEEGEGSGSTSEGMMVDEDIPFAKVDGVSPGSPAALAVSLT